MNALLKQEILGGVANLGAEPLRRARYWERRTGIDNIQEGESAFQRYLRLIERRRLDCIIPPEDGASASYPLFGDLKVDATILLLIPRVAVRLDEVRLVARRVLRKNDTEVIRRVARALEKDSGVPAASIIPLFDLASNTGRPDYAPPTFHQDQIEAVIKLSRLLWVSATPRAHLLKDSERGRVIKMKGNRVR